MNIFEKISATVNDAEDSIINLLCVISPWLVPVIPAFLTYWHTIKDLSFPVWVAWTSAIVVEVLGLASMRTSISFFEHNKRYSKETNKAPFGVTIGTYVFYLVVILTVNVLLDVTNGVKWMNIVAVGLFSLLSVPAGVLISVRTQHSELLKELSERRTRTNTNRRTNTNERTPKTRSPRANERTNSGELRTVVYQLLDEYYQTNDQVAGVSDLARTIAKSKNGTEEGYERYKGYISEVRKDWLETKQ